MLLYLGFVFVLGSLEGKVNVVDIIYVFCKENLCVKVVVGDFLGVIRVIVNFFCEDFYFRVV